LKADSPELEGILQDLHEKASELKDKIEPLRQLVNEINKHGAVDDEIVDYLQVKQQILLSYCMNVTFYIYMKSLGLSVRNHPVMRQLLELRYCMEKMRPLDGKLKYQIDRLVNLKSLDSEAVKNATLRPNISAMLGDSDDDEPQEESKSSKKTKKQGNHRDKSKVNLNNRVAEEDDEEITIPDSDDEKSNASDRDDDDEGDDEDDDVKPSAEKYRPPKVAAMKYDDDESKAEKRDRQLELKRKKLRHSEILQAMREQYGDDPENLSSTGITLESSTQKELDEEEEDRRNYEEDRFIRLVSCSVRTIRLIPRLMIWHFS
jgi:hypothetical protein